MKFVLREWKTEDADSVAKYANNPKIAGNLRDGFPSPYTPEDARLFVADCLRGQKGMIMLAIEIGGEAAGSIGVFRQDNVYRKSAELGYWLGEPFWGKGVMSAAVSEMCALAFGAWDIVRIFAEPFAGNAASRGVLEKAGFALEGILKRSVFKNGSITDSCIYAVTKG